MEEEEELNLNNAKKELGNFVSHYSLIFFFLDFNILI